MRNIGLILLVAQSFATGHSYRMLGVQSPDKVKQTYYANHTQQTLDFVLKKKAEYHLLNKRSMGLWDAMKLLDDYIDDSDPDTELSQSAHAFQTAEALRRDGHPRWLILTGLIHDLGKLLHIFGEPSWAVVGDTYPVGCAYSPTIAFHEYFCDNPDYKQNHLQTRLGIYHQGCGFDQVHMSFGHDEYLYYVMKPYLPKEALYVIRYHSFYPAHQQEAYTELMDDYDRKMLPYLKLFSQYDLYSKSSEVPDIEEIRPYYESLVSEFFSGELNPTLQW